MEGGLSFEEDLITECLKEITPWASSGDICSETICKECKHTLKSSILEGRYVCSNCGLDQGSVLECNTNGRIMDRHNTNIERIGTPIDPHLPKSSMGTSIRWSRNVNMLRLRKFHQWNAMPTGERGLYQVYKYITTHCSQEKFKIPKKIQDTAKTMFQVISEHFKTRGAKRKGLIAACVYYSCKQEAYPYDPSTIADAFCIRSKDISCGIRVYQTVVSGIDHPVFKTGEKTTKPEDYIGRYCTMLDIKDVQFMKISEAMCRKIVKLGICESYTPTTIALTVMAYIMEKVNPKKTHKEFCIKADVSPGTISRCKKIITENEESILPPKILKIFTSTKS